MEVIKKMVVYIEDWGEEVIISCPINYLKTEECNQYHRGALGCDPNCPYRDMVKDFTKFSKLVFLDEKELNEFLKRYIKKK